MQIEELVKDPVERAILTLHHKVGKYLLRLESLTAEEQFDVTQALAEFRKETDWPQTSVDSYVKTMVTSAHQADNILNKKKPSELN